MQDFQGEVKVWIMWMFLLVAKHDILSGLHDYNVYTCYAYINYTHGNSKFFLNETAT